MKAMPEGYQRKGHVATLQIDHDAWAMLLEIAPTYKAMAGMSPNSSDVIMRCANSGAAPCPPAGCARRGGT